MGIATTKEAEEIQIIPYGLHNQGATCYLNSVLQLLVMTPELHNRLKPSSKVDQELKTLFENLKKGPCKTENITKHLQIHDVYKQCDAAEYLELILNTISQSASEIFRGMLTNLTKCFDGHIINKETNPFLTLPLPLKDADDGHYSVEKSLERIFKTKIFNGDNLVYCNDCKRKTKAQRGCEMERAPQVLILLLKRFVFDHSTQSHVKSNCSVEIPATLQIKGKKTNYNYTLYGRVDHMESLRGGHYTATTQSSDDKTWYKFNDTHVQKVEEQIFDLYRSQTAYLLTYRGNMQEEPRNQPKEKDALLSGAQDGMIQESCPEEETRKTQQKHSKKPENKHSSEASSIQKRYIVLVVFSGGLILIICLLLFGRYMNKKHLCLFCM